MWAIREVFCCCTPVQLCGGSFLLSLKRRLANFYIFLQIHQLFIIFRFRQVYCTVKLQAVTL